MGFDSLMLLTKDGLDTLLASDGSDHDPCLIPASTERALLEAVQEAGFAPCPDKAATIEAYLADGVVLVLYLDVADEPVGSVTLYGHQMVAIRPLVADDDVCERHDELAHGLADRFDLVLYEPRPGDPMLDPPEAPILDQVASDDPQVRLEAIRHLGYADTNPSYAVAPRQAVELLTTAARHDNVERVRHTALESLGRLGEQGRLAQHVADAVDVALACLSDQDVVIQYWATYALGRFGPSAERALPILRRRAASGNYGPRYGSLDAIERINSSLVDNDH